MTLRPKNLKNKLIFFPEIENTSAGNGSTTPFFSPRLCLSVCPAIKAYISVTKSWILMKLGESVGT